MRTGLRMCSACPTNTVPSRSRDRIEASTRAPIDRLKIRSFSDVTRRSPHQPEQQNPSICHPGRKLPERHVKNLDVKEGWLHGYRAICFESKRSSKCREHYAVEGLMCPRIVRDRLASFAFGSYLRKWRRRPSTRKEM